MNATALRAAKRSLAGYLQCCTIPLETGGTGKLVLTATQEDVYRELSSGPCGGPGVNLIVNKPRQSNTSTLVLGWMLREVHLNAGYTGLLMCNKDATNQELWNRLRGMSDGMPPALAIPTVREAAKMLSFSHKGHLKVETAKGTDAGLGLGLDRMHCSEFGFWRDGRTVLSKVFPAVAKRQHARIVVESTPGAMHGAFHDLWLRSLDGRTAFKPLFIRWYDFDSYMRPTEGFVPTQEELAYALKYEGVRMGHLAFRRYVLDTACRGDTRLFDHYYPPDEYTGWQSSENPALPEEGIKAQLINAEDDPAYMQGWEAPQVGEKYIILVDPNGYGNVGDPSAYSVFSLTRRTEVSAWSGRIDPNRFGRDLARMGKLWNDALIVVESNSAACITSLVNTGYRNVWMDGGTAHPGYYRTAMGKERAQIALVDALREGTLRFRSRQTLHQLLSWDGNDSRPTEDG
ncbi:hypothetical protein EBT31_16405, partial [bacterium]|nr:hypothetical protein [bacterium]